jgi:NADPH2:quinone reductase
MGARVIGTVGSDDKIDLVKSHGATDIINYRKDSIKDRVKQLTDGKGADVIFDLVGGDAFDQSIRCINWDGRILVIGFASGRIPQLPLNLPLLKNCSIVGVFSGLWCDKFPDQWRQMGNEIMGLVAGGELKPYVSEILLMDRAVEAFEMIANRQATGRVVLGF